MRIRVYIRDGHTCYRLAKRSDLGDLITREPHGAKPSKEVEVAYWNGSEAAYGAFVPWRLRFIAKGSISTVEEDPT
ncbi:MAG: hypothetical protein JWN10_932 [Solirubrobacterales bacterium]|nr:hypothetical protein [Solirubrobacterales bacterium]